MSKTRSVLENMLMDKLDSLALGQNLIILHQTELTEGQEDTRSRLHRHESSQHN